MLLRPPVIYRASLGGKGLHRAAMFATQQLYRCHTLLCLPFMNGNLPCRNLVSNSPGTWVQTKDTGRPGRAGLVSRLDAESGGDWAPARTYQTRRKNARIDVKVGIPLPRSGLRLYIVFCGARQSNVRLSEFQRGVNQIWLEDRERLSGREIGESPGRLCRTQDA